MNESVAAPAVPVITYRSLVEEAFIGPIRTTVVVDDEYPTLDELLEDARQQDSEGEKDKVVRQRKNTNRPAVRKILQFCRNRKPTPWIVDIHDGRTPSLASEQTAAAHLTHSDLLILDYHLEANGLGARAVEILQQLAGNGHFNLVVVYTKEQEGDGGGIDRTVDEIAFGLLYPNPSLNLHSKRVENCKNRLSPWEEKQESIYEQLLGAIDRTAFFSIFEFGTTKWESVCGLPELEPLSRLLKEMPVGLDMTADDVFSLIMHTRQQEFLKEMSPIDGGSVSKGRNDKGANWIRTDSLFITVISKARDASEIPDLLLDSLEAWDPEPHRLIMSKLRSELDAQGVVAEQGILGNVYLQSGWLSQLLEKDSIKRKANARLNVSRHWESLGDRIGNSVEDFAERMATHLLNGKTDVLARFDQHGALGAPQQVHIELNRHACSKPVEGHHLATGQVLRVKVDNSQQYWLCLSPACDLVPGQGDDRGWKKRLGPWLPFKAVLIHETGDVVFALKNATRGYHLFLSIDGHIQAFELIPKDNEEKGTADDIPTLRWEQFFADNQGRFDTSTQNLEVARIGKAGSLEVQKHTATIVAQLRYEYALNLMHRLGAQLSRVGLDFIAWVPAAPAAEADAAEMVTGRGQSTQSREVN